MKPTALGAALSAATLLAVPGPSAAQPAAAKSCDPVDIFCGVIPDLTTGSGWTQLFNQLRGSPTSANAAVAPDDPGDKPALELPPETPEEAARDRALEAADRLAVQRAGQAREAARNSAYTEELAAIQVEDASTLRFLSTDCANDDAPSRACLDDVARARGLEPRMQALLAKPGAADFLTRKLRTTWRPESPIRAAAVKLLFEAGSGSKAARDYVKANSFRSADGGFLGCRSARLALVEERGEPSLAQTIETDATNMWDPDRAISRLAAIQGAGQGDTAANAYRTCVLRARWAELHKQTLNPAPVIQAAATPASASAGGSVASSLFNQSAGQAQANPQAAAAALAAKKNSRAAELDDLTRKGQARADAIMNTVMIGVTAYAQASIAAAAAPATPGVSSAGFTGGASNGSASAVAGSAGQGPSSPTGGRQASAGSSSGASGSKVRTTANPAASANVNDPALGATGCMSVVNAKSAGISSNFTWHGKNSCGYAVSAIWTGGDGRYTNSAEIEPNGNHPLADNQGAGTRFIACRRGALHQTGGYGSSTVICHN